MTTYEATVVDAETGKALTDLTRTAMNRHEAWDRGVAALRTAYPDAILMPDPQDPGAETRARYQYDTPTRTLYVYVNP